MNNLMDEFFEWMNPISGMFTDNSGQKSWLENFEATKDVFYKTVDGYHRGIKAESVMSAFIIRGDNVTNPDWEVIIIGQWDFIKQIGWHSSDLES